MEEKLKSEGRCLFCNELILQSKIGTHLAAHLAKMEKIVDEKKAKTFYHIKVESGQMFLQLIVKGSTKMETIDNFLRRIWLECCGHLSEFEHNREEISMSRKVSTVFEPKIKIEYQYDFGTTTYLELKGLKQYNLDLKDNISLLSRNEPLALMCAECKTEPAIFICSTCSCQRYSFFCKKCSKKHAKTCQEFDDYSKMPVVNSPRMGECGYEGGLIDLERDGIYKKAVI